MIQLISATRNIVGLLMTADPPCSSKQCKRLDRQHVHILGMWSNSVTVLGTATVQCYACLPMLAVIVCYSQSVVQCQ